MLLSKHTIEFVFSTYVTSNTRHDLAANLFSDKTDRLITVRSECINIIVHFPESISSDIRHEYRPNQLKCLCMRNVKLCPDACYQRPFKVAQFCGPFCRFQIFPVYKH